MQNINVTDGRIYTPTAAFTSSNMNTMLFWNWNCVPHIFHRSSTCIVYPMNAVLLLWLWRIYIFIIRSYDIFMVCAYFPLFMENLCYHLQTVWIWIWDGIWDWDQEIVRPKHVLLYASIFIYSMRYAHFITYLDIQMNNILRKFKIIMIIMLELAATNFSR